MLFVKNWPAAKEYYTTALKPLGYVPVIDWGTGGGFGAPGEKSGNFYVSQSKKLGEGPIGGVSRWLGGTLWPAFSSRKATLFHLPSLSS